MKNKPNLSDLPPYDAETFCDECGQPGAADFQTQTLCPKCVAIDVFEGYNEN